MQDLNPKKIKEQSRYLRDAFKDLEAAYHQIGLAAAKWEMPLTDHMRGKKQDQVKSKTDLEALQIHVGFLRNNIGHLSKTMKALDKELSRVGSAE